MKKWLVIFVLVSLSFVSASIEVHDYDIVLGYSSLENISGEINITIRGEDYDSLITSNDDDEIALGEFFENNGIVDYCVPRDCSKNYKAVSGSLENSFDLSQISEKELGFLLEGDDVVLHSIGFKMSSNFGESSKVPLVIDFFDREEWEFNEFSEFSFLDKNYGCYDSSNGAPESFVGELLYCEMIYVPNSKRLYVGAEVSGSDDVNLEMDVFPESGVGGSWSCDYDPASTDGCYVETEGEDIFSAGEYQICVSASESTDYKIYQESFGYNCGFAYVSGPEGSTKDYAIFVQGMKYADSTFLNVADFNFDDMVFSGNDFLDDKYGGDCSSGCVLPLTFSGVDQIARIYDVEVWYTEDLQLKKANEVYTLDVDPVLIDYSGVLDLGLLGFNVSESMGYKLYLDNTKLFEEDIEISAVPIVLDVFPTSVPAGIPVSFYVDVDFEWSMPLFYEWNFGDGGGKKISKPYINHTYLDLKNYTLNVEVSSGNLSSNKSFEIEVVSPKDAVDEVLAVKNESLSGVLSTLASFPFWYRGYLSSAIDMDYYLNEIERLGDSSEVVLDDRYYVDIVKDLYALKVPSGIRVSSDSLPYLDTKVSDVDVAPVKILDGSSGDVSNSDYASPILNWQVSKIDGSLSKRTFEVLFSSGEKEGVFSVYSFNVSSKANEKSYFVINRDIDELNFREDVGAEEAGDATIIELGPGEKMSFDFYYEGVDPTTFFVSPKLNSIVVESSIDFSCNYNSVCEEGENSDSCRSDCKPLGRALFYVGLALVFLLIVYTVVQQWYKNNYEAHLFKDKKQLYNILMYVTNARAKGMKDSRIRADLRKTGWSSERVNYVVKKSKGKNVGLPEIIPISHVSAYLRNRKARKKFATRPQQQIGRNINKSNFQNK
jgi:PKD repeat protein